ncbi:MAG: GDP-mannose pyrophosphatase NudK [Saprospiraceae bacterium]|nr:GDP-mannose pyrophosphatase NudK [Saprospiraceae bacterium]
MNVVIKEQQLLSDNWYKLYKVTFDYLLSNGKWQKQIREVYDRGNGATILLFNSKSKNVVLTKQFRMPTFLNGNADGMVIEACAGLLDNENPEACIRRETNEETGYRVKEIKKIFEAYMSPGAVTEILHFYIGEYDNQMKTGVGGGLPEEQEDIEVLELSFEEAYAMISTGEIKDAKTILLLQYAKINGIV